MLCENALCVFLWDDDTHCNNITSKKSTTGTRLKRYVAGLHYADNVALPL